MDSISTKVDSHNGLYATTLGELRDEAESDRLGKYVMERIVKNLHGEGLGYFPAWVLDDNETPRQHQEVRVYRRGSLLADMVEAVEDPSSGGDDALREMADDSQADIINRVRELVCP